MSDIFQLRLANRPSRDKHEIKMEIPKANQFKLGTNSLQAFDPKIWNSLPYQIKSNKDNFAIIPEKNQGTINFKK